MVRREGLLRILVLTRDGHLNDVAMVGRLDAFDPAHIDQSIDLLIHQVFFGRGAIVRRNIRCRPFVFDPVPVRRIRRRRRRPGMRDGQAGLGAPAQDFLGAIVGDMPRKHRTPVLRNHHARHSARRARDEPAQDGSGFQVR
jgi:hypothetical protein